MLISVREWKDVFQCPMVWPIAAVLSYLALSSLWSEDFTGRDFFSQITRALLTFTFVVAVAECQLRGAMQKWLFTGLAWAGGGVAILCIILFYNSPTWDGRLNGLGQLDTQVVAGLVFDFAALAVLHNLLCGAGAPRWFSWGLFAALVFAVYLTGSRSAITSLFIGVFSLIVAHRVQRVPVYLASMGLVVLIIGLVLGMAVLTPEGRDYLLPRGDSHRLHIWSSTLERLQNSPWWGLGILTSDDVMLETLRFHHPHNLYLSVAFQGGLIGLLLFVWLLQRTARELLRGFSSPDAKFALSVLCMALPAYLLDGHELLDKISDTWFLIWLPVALALSLRWHSTYR